MLRIDKDEVIHKFRTVYKHQTGNDQTSRQVVIIANILVDEINYKLGEIEQEIDELKKRIGK